MFDPLHRDLVIGKVRKKTKKKLSTILSQLPGTKVEWRFSGPIALQLSSKEDGVIATGDYNIYLINGIVNIMENKRGTLADY